MRKILISGIILFLFCVIISPVYAGLSDVFRLKKHETINISNSFFSFYVPEKLTGLYEVKKTKFGIYMYDKPSKKAGFGGFAFGIQLFEKPSDHAMMPGSKKVGEFEDKKGVIYDVVLHHPTDVQYDYVNQKSASYDVLYDYADVVVKNIKPKNNCKYYYQRGAKGKGLYNNILEKHLTAIKEKWDSIRLEKEDMSYMYNVIALSGKSAAEKIGYTYFDINGDGIEELLIGEIADGDWKGIVYDLYTMVNRKPVHVISGGSRDRYYVCDGYFICNEYSGGAYESGMLVYILTENSTELFPQVGFKYDGYTNKENPWFISYDFANDKWQEVDEDFYNQRKSTFDKYERFDYIPLGNYTEDLKNKKD